MYENFDQILKTMICDVRMAFLFDLAVSEIWPITNPPYEMRIFSYLKDNLLSIDVIILHTKII